MKHFLKGAAAVVITTVISMAIHILCNLNGINLDSTAATIVAAFFAILIYQGLIRNEK